MSLPEKTLIDAPPHDIGKVKYWRRHSNEEILPSFIPEAGREDVCPIPCRDLRRYVKKHHSLHTLSMADRISAAIGRSKFEYNYWEGREDEDYYFFKVYGEPVVWSKRDRDKLWLEIEKLLRRGLTRETYSQINDVLKYFPQDSRFPFVSLKTHHWATQAIYEQICRLVEEKLVRNEGDILDNNLYLIFVSAYYPGVRGDRGGRTFHKLRDMRKFFSLKRELLGILRARLARFRPLTAGDDLIIISLSERHRDKVLTLLEETGMPLDVQIFAYQLRKIEFEGALGRRRPHVVVDAVGREELSLSSVEDFDISPRKADWRDVLGGRFDLVAWIFFRSEDILASSEFFLAKTEEYIKSLERRGSMRRKEIPQRLSIDVISPDLLVTVAEGYEEFINQVIGRVWTRSPYRVIESLEKIVLLWGLKRKTDALEIYTRIAQAVDEFRPRVPISWSIAVSNPKHPFWHVLKIMEEVEGKYIVFIGGGKLVILEDEDVQAIREVIPDVKEVSRKKMMELAGDAKRMRKEHLKLKIEALRAEEKINGKAEKALITLVDLLAERHPDEIKRRKATRMAFEHLSSFASRGV